MNAPPKTRGPSPARPAVGDERGFSLMEVIVAASIATVAVLGLAYTFGLGRSFIDRYEASRLAQGEARAVLEQLRALPLTSDSLHVNSSWLADSLRVDGAAAGTVGWSVGPAVSLVAPNVLMRRVTVNARWTSGAQPESLALTRLFPMP
ncbi:MAG TPA: type II secretion system protein [Candidatus Eisenbacteria bacterium]|nr:type II secretion system protein [Candidatus Eisenbacteria bacterium]